MRNAKKYQYWLSMAAIIFYNNWILAFILNPQALRLGATTSELGATDQPWSLLFRMLDITAGIFFVLGAGAIAGLSTRKLVRLFLIIEIGAFGLSTIIESLSPLSCSSALSTLCEQKEKLGLVNWQHSFHIIESVASYAALALLPVVVLLFLHLRKDCYRLKITSLALILYMVVWGIESSVKYAHNAASYGYEQYVFIVIFSLWYVQAIQKARLAKTH